MPSAAAAPKLLRTTGIVFLLIAGYIAFRLFRDPLKHELNYIVATKRSTDTALTPPSTDFGLVIEKIGAAATVMPNIDPLNSQLYQRALQDGVAHAKGTAYPGEGKNIFIFAHSSADLLTAQRYNSIFYLMHHLEPGDLIKIWYQGVQHSYAVSDKKIVASSDTAYLTEKSTTEQLTLMTCWPPGTDYKRLIVVADPVR